MPATANKKIKTVSADVSPDTNIYAAGDQLGIELSFSNVLLDDMGGGIVKSAILTDLSTNAAAIDLILFSANPSIASSDNNEALDITDSDLVNVCGKFHFSTGSYIQLADNEIAISSDIDQAFYLSSTDRTLYGVCISGGTPTYSSTSDLKVLLQIENV